MRGFRSSVITASITHMFFENLLKNTIVAVFGFIFLTQIADATLLRNEEFKIKKISAYLH